MIDKIMCAVVPEGSRACRDYRVKFPDDVLHDSLAGQLWFGAEVCHLSHFIRAALYLLLKPEKLSRLKQVAVSAAMETSC